MVSPLYGKINDNSQSNVTLLIGASTHHLTIHPQYTRAPPSINYVSTVI